MVRLCFFLDVVAIHAAESEWHHKSGEVHNKLAPGCLGYIGDEMLPSSVGIAINHEIRIPLKQPVIVINNPRQLERPKQ